jgi:hypothetical protein
MTGDIETNKNKFVSFLKNNGIIPRYTKTAIDCGAGNGIQSVALTEVGFVVHAIDFNKHLLNELEINKNEYNINVYHDDIRNIGKYAIIKPEILTCCGDTLLHLSNKNEITDFIKDAKSVLIDDGKLIISFRDYSHELVGIKRFIPVKSDETRILTCVLDYSKEYVTVTDLLYEKENNTWKDKISSYDKVRMLPIEIIDLIKNHKMNINFNKNINGMITIIAEK